MNLHFIDHELIIFWISFGINIKIKKSAESTEMIPPDQNLFPQGCRALDQIHGIHGSERERDLLVILDRSVWDLCLIFPYLGQVKYVKCWVFPGFSVIRRGFQPDIQIPTINQHGPCGNLRLCTMEHVTFLDDLPIKSYQTCLFSHSQLVNYQRVSPFYPVIFPWIFHYIPS